MSQQATTFPTNRNSTILSPDDGSSGTGAVAPFQTKAGKIKGIALRKGVEFVRQKSELVKKRRFP